MLENTTLKSHFNIQLADYHDVETLHLLHAQAILQLGRSQQHFLLPMTADQIHALVAHDRMLLATNPQTGQIIGMLSAKPSALPRGTYTEQPVDDNLIELNSFVVRSDTRNTGIGAALIQAGLNLARQQNASCAFAKATVDNTISQRAFVRAGFIQIGTAPRASDPRVQLAILAHRIGQA